MSELVSINRVTIAAELDRVRGLLEPAAGLPIPALGSITSDHEARLRRLGGGRLGCTVIVLRTRVVEGQVAPNDLARETLATTVEHLVGRVRASDLLLAVPPDVVTLLSPGLAPLEARALQARLEREFPPHDLGGPGLLVRVTPAIGFADIGPGTTMPVRALIEEARRRARPTAIAAR